MENKKSVPTTLWDIRWFRIACLTVLLAPPLLFIAGTAAWVAFLLMSGDFATLRQAWNQLSVPVAVTLLFLSGFWFIYRDYRTTKDLNPDPQVLHVEWSELKLALFCLPLIAIVPITIVSAIWGFTHPDLLFVVALGALAILPYLVLAKRFLQGAFVLAEQGLILPALGSNRPVPWKNVWPSVGLFGGRPPFAFLFFTLTLTIDPHAYPNLRGGLKIKGPGDTIQVDYSFPAAFTATKWSIMKRIQEFKARDEQRKTGGKRN